MKQFVLSAALGLSLIGATVVASEVPDAAQLELGKALFITDAVPSCTLCHTLKDADSAGAIGPDLDELKPGLSDAISAMRTGVGVMPSFAETLTEEQIEAIAAYVVHATGGGN